MKKLFVILAMIVGLAPLVSAADYQYVTAEQLNGWLEAARPVELVDIQEAKDFASHHIKGSVETNAYPVKSDKDKQGLKLALEQSLDQDYEAIVIVCPRGKGGAKRTYDHMVDKGVPAGKLFILAGGMANWPYEKWVAKK